MGLLAAGGPWPRFQETARTLGQLCMGDLSPCVTISQKRGLGPLVEAQPHLGTKGCLPGWSPQPPRLDGKQPGVSCFFF